MALGAPARPGDLILLAGTRKGAFILTGDSTRNNWHTSGPFCPGSDVFHLVYDHRNGGQVLAAANHVIWGPQVEYSRDLGQTWAQAAEQPRFTGEGGATVNRIWHIEPGRETEPATLYLGVEPAALFRSRDGGDTWHEVTGLSNHPTRTEWNPGFGGLCLHSIGLDPQNADRMWVGISAAGVFRTDDGGQRWRPANRGVRADFDPANPLPEWGQCPHKVLPHPGAPGLLYQQNHCGVYRSSDYGDSWQDLSEGLPSRFGFVLGLHPTEPDTLYVLPEDEAIGTDVGGMLRYVSGAKCRVFRSRNGGRKWEPLTQGLPQQNAYLHTLREGMATDYLEPLGIYFGTVNGQIFHSRDDGDHWRLLVEHLPPINSVEVATVV